MSNVRLFGLDQPAGPFGLGHSLIRQIDIRPSSEEVFLIPDALAMTQENKFCHRSSCI